jgi:D-glycerate 3-kinase
VIDPGLDSNFVQPLLAELTALAVGACSGSGRQVVALNGPVGAGKSTLGALLLARAGAQGVRLAVASIDDFYLPWARRCQALAGNPFGVSRVLPGSHDVELALACLADWRGGAALRLPRFDKTLRDGQGDRAGVVSLDVDVLLLEGWLLGCQPVGPERLADAQLDSLLTEERTWLPHWDRALEAYQPLWQSCAQLWLLRPLTWNLPRRWRFQAEARQRRWGGAWLPPQDLEAVVRSSLCSLLPSLYQDPLIPRARGMAVLDGRRRWVGQAVIRA